MQTEQVVQLDPAKVLANAGENAARFSTSDVDVQGMMDSILAQGGVMQPVEVMALTPPTKTHTHRLVYGFRRHAAVLALNKDQNAGLTLPAIIRDIDAGDIIKRQIAENNDRKTMSPMDKAVAIKRLFNSGVGKPEIRRIFASIGGKKADQVREMSNASLNIYLNFLELPKAIQEKIHTGAIGVSAAYMLGKVSPDKRAAIVERAEKERADIEAGEARDEEKFLNAESKVEEAKAKQVKAEGAVESARADVAAAEVLVKDKTKTFNDVKKAILVSNEPAGPADVEKVKAAEADHKGAQKTLKDAKNKLAKALNDSKMAEEKAAERATQLEAARKLKGKKKAGKSKGEGLTRDDVKKAGAKEGEKNLGHVPLTLSDLRSALKDLQKDGVPARVSQIGKAFAKLLNGELTPKLLIEDLTLILKGTAADKSAKA